MALFYGTPKLSDYSTRLYELHTFLYMIGAVYYLGPINTRTGNYSAKYLFYRYDDVAVTGFRLECAKINRVGSELSALNNHIYVLFVNNTSTIMKS